MIIAKQTVVKTYKHGPRAKLTMRSLTSVALALAGITLSSNNFATPTDNSGAIANLGEQIDSWSKGQFGAPDVYSFSIQDRRLKVPKCAKFTFSTSTSLTKPRSAFMVKASCLDNDWSRFIRAKATAKLSTEVALISVLTPNKIIEAGKRVTAQDIEVTQLPPNRTPQGSISSLKPSAQWFSLRTMRPGHIITRNDLAEPREVLVVTRALPAGTLLTAKAVRIEQRAANVPRDALTSTANLANLAASKLLHPGDILRKRDLTKGKLIRRGEKVALLSQGLSYAISSEVVALEDGFLGEQVRLLNTESQRRVSAIVTGPSRAKTLATKW